MISSKEAYDEYHLLVDAPDRALQLLSFLPQECASVEDGMLAVKLARTQEGEEELLPRINRTLVLGGISLYTVTKRESRSLEDVFIELTGEGGAQIE